LQCNNKETLTTEQGRKEADMTTATLSLHRPDAFGMERIAGFAAQLRQAWRERLARAEALRALQAMSLRQREDVGVVGLDLDDVVRAAELRR
jgi:uncharacterized protein YjiS (DUF1127 family)